MIPKLPTFLYFRSFTYKRCSNTSTKNLVKKFICDNEGDPPPPLKGLTFVNENSCEKIDVRKTIQFVLQRMKVQTIQQKCGKTRHFYLVINQGILQGDTLSTALCNIYFGHMAKTHLSRFQESIANQTNGLFARGVDDFIFVTKDKELAKQYLHVMEKGFAEDYSCTIQQSKTATNFDSTTSLTSPQTSAKLRFCGTIINPSTLQCRPNFEGYHHKNVSYASSLAMTFPQPKFDFITNKLLFICTLHLKPLYIDEEVNGQLVALENIFEATYLVALKLHSLFSSMEAISLLQQGQGNNQLKSLVNKIIRKMMTKYRRIVKACDLLQKQKNGLRLIAHTLRYAFVSVLHRKFGSYYKDLTLPWVDYQLVPVALLDECIKTRQTFKIKSKAYFKL